MSPRRRWDTSPGSTGSGRFRWWRSSCTTPGFAWIHGGFFAIDIFFAASGFLITSLLLEEQDRTGRIALGGFWMRRARRLLPALAVLLATVAVVALFAGTDQQIASFRRDLPWAVGYLSNWGQITGDVPYWAADPPLLRHLWTLAIEEQFYVLWPLAFFGLRRLRSTSAAIVLVGLTVATWVVMFVVHAGAPAPMAGLFAGADRVNFSYLSTATRAGTLLLGECRRIRLAPLAGHGSACRRLNSDGSGTCSIGPAVRCSGCSSPWR